MLTSPGTGDDRPVFLQSSRSVFRTDGGSGLRRFDAAADVGDNLFDGGGMLVAVTDAQPTATTAGVLAAKWSTDGWIIFRFASAVAALESYAAGGTAENRFEFPIPVGSRFLVEIEWDSASPTTAPVVRINGSAVTVTASAAAPGVVNDAPATLCVGNRNWGTNQTPWIGSIGEIAMFSAIPTLPQRSAIRSDFMTHWQLS